jgi:hypothetical protein
MRFIFELANYSLFTTVYKGDFPDQHFLNKIFYSRCPKYSGNLENYRETKGKKDDCSGELPSPSFNNFCLSL